MPVDIGAHQRLSRELLSSNAMVIGNERISDTAEDRFEHVDPATGQVQASVVMAGRSEVEAAVAAAVAAQRVWWGWRPDERRNALLRLVALLRADEDRLAPVLALEAGVPLTMAAGLPRRPWTTPFPSPTASSRPSPPGTAGSAHSVARAGPPWLPATPS